MGKKSKLKSGFEPIHIILIIFMIIQLFPLYYLFIMSFKDSSEIFGENVIGLPEKWMWSNYETAVHAGDIGLYFINSIVVTVGTILLCLTCATMASYALTRLIWKRRELMNKYFMLGLTVPIHASLLPVFLVLRELHMLNSYQALILPYVAFSLAMGILICSGFMAGIPGELEESACLDGCSVYQIFFRIIVPLMKPAFATMTIFSFLQSWNELMFATIFISKERYRTLTVGIQNLTSAYTTDWGAIAASLVIVTLPVIVLYSILSGKIQESMVAGAIKG